MTADDRYCEHTDMLGSGHPDMLPQPEQSTRPASECYWTEQALPMVEVALALRHLAHVHEHDFPDVTVYVLKATPIHEAEVLQRVHVCLAAVSGSGCNHVVNCRVVVGAQAQHDFAGSVGVDNRLLGESSPLRVSEQHHVDAVGDNHAGGGVVAELRVVDCADCFIKGLSLGRSATGRLTKICLGI